MLLNVLPQDLSPNYFNENLICSLDEKYLLKIIFKVNHNFDLFASYRLFTGVSIVLYFRVFTVCFHIIIQAHFMAAVSPCFVKL